VARDLQIPTYGVVKLQTLGTGGKAMARGDKSKYTDKQKRKAEHIAEGYEDRGVSDKEAKRRAWATVNKESGGGKKSGSGRGKKESHASSRKGGKLGGAASASRSAAERSASAKKAAQTRARRREAGAYSR
jgi:plasmid stabilization system protein ParE